jgi:hypothetical protein
MINDGRFTGSQHAKIISGNAKFSKAPARRRATEINPGHPFVTPEDDRVRRGRIRTAGFKGLFRFAAGGMVFLSLEDRFFLLCRHWSVPPFGPPVLYIRTERKALATQSIALNLLISNAGSTIRGAKQEPSCKDLMPRHGPRAYPPG